MVNLKDFDIQVERVDDIPLVYGSLQRMGIQPIIDSILKPHGNWQGLSPGWVITLWLTHILVRHTHRMDCVQEWVEKHLFTLGQLTGQTVTALDFTDDRLALCLRDLHVPETWSEIESRLGNRLMRVYDLKQKQSPHWWVRLDATVGSVTHDPSQSTLFQLGKAKNGLYEILFKMMVASLDPLGLALVVDVVAGNCADDPLYLPSYERLKKMFPGQGLLVIGDSKMSALNTRATIAANQDHYLTPLAYLKDEPQLLNELLTGKESELETMPLIFLSADLPADGTAPDPNLAIARGVEVSRERTMKRQGQSFTWSERLLVVRSFSYTEGQQRAFQQRLAKAEAALTALTPLPGRGKVQMTTEKALLAAIKQVEKANKVQGLFTYQYHQEVKERKVGTYNGQPARLERKVRYQLTVTRQQKAIDAQMFRLGWRIYATNAPATDLSLTQAVEAYREQYLVENIFRRLQGKLLSITPVYVQRDDHALGLFHLLTLAARALALGDYTVKEALAQTQEALTGIYPGNPKRGTTTPTTERMLQVFEHIDLTILKVGEQVQRRLTPLTPVQERILTLMGLSLTLYTNLVAA
jgi:transposase